MRITLPLLALPLALSACQSGGGTGDTGNAAAATQRPTAAQNAVTPAPTPTPTPKVEPIKLSTENAAIDFEYTVPAEAAAIPALRDRLLARAKSDKAEMIGEQAEYAKDMKKHDFPVHAYGLTTNWKTVADTSQLLVLVAEGYRYTGGAHGSDLYEALIWDKAKGSRITFGDLFTDKDKALATIRKPFCDTLDRMRFKRRGKVIGQPGDYFNRCPKFDEPITLAPAKTVGGKFARIGVWIPADVAGAHAEGSYDYDLVIPKAMADLVKPEYRPSFPGT